MIRLLKYLKSTKQKASSGVERLTVCVSGGWVGVEKAWEPENLEGRKKLKNSYCTHPSAARCVGRTACYRDYDLDYSPKSKSGPVLSRRKSNLLDVWRARRKAKRRKTIQQAESTRPADGRANQERSQAQAFFHEVSKPRKA